MVRTLPAFLRGFNSSIAGFLDGEGIIAGSLLADVEALRFVGVHFGRGGISDISLNSNG